MNYYEVLMIGSNATNEEIEIAYKSLIKKHHPDINSSPLSTKISQELNNARNVLKDDIKRREYDAWLKQCDDLRNGRIKNKSDASANNKSEAKTTSNEKNSHSSLYATPYMELNEWDYFRFYLKRKDINLATRMIFGTIIFIWLIISGILKLAIEGLRRLSTLICSYALMWMILSGGLILLVTFLERLEFFSSAESIWNIQDTSSFIAQVLIALIVIFLPFISTYILAFLFDGALELFRYFNLKLFKKLRK